MIKNVKAKNHYSGGCSEFYSLTSEKKFVLPYFNSGQEATKPTPRKKSSGVSYYDKINNGNSNNHHHATGSPSTLKNDHPHRAGGGGGGRNHQSNLYSRQPSSHSVGNYVAVQVDPCPENETEETSCC